MGLYKLLVMQTTIPIYGLLLLPCIVQLLDLTTTLEWFYSRVALISYVNIIDHDFIKKGKYVNNKMFNTQGTINPISLLLGGNQSPCFSGNSFLPCNCESELDGMGLVTRKITCPSGSSTSQIKNAFARIPIQGKRIGKVILNFSGSTSIPDNILGQHSVDSVQLIGTSSANTISVYR